MYVSVRQSLSLSLSLSLSVCARFMAVTAVVDRCDWSRSGTAIVFFVCVGLEVFYGQLLCARPHPWACQYVYATAA